MRALSGSPAATPWDPALAASMQEIGCAVMEERLLPDCGTLETAEPSLHGNPYRPSYTWTCPGCGVERSYRFRISPALPNQDVAPPAELGGDEPSRIVAPEALAAEVRRLTPLVPAEPETLDPEAWGPRVTGRRSCASASTSSRRSRATTSQPTARGSRDACLDGPLPRP